MAGQITLSVEQYKCLRGHLNAIEQILGSEGRIGSGLEIKKAPRPRPKETRREGINKYKDLIESGTRVRKPEYLKK
jgi:hypothetical protein